MVEQIFDTKTMLEEIKKHYGQCIELYLEEAEIKEWRESGKFLFLRKELANLPKLKFSCEQHYNGACSYIFICNTKELHDRMVIMLNNLYTYNEKVRLMKCEYSSESFTKSIEGNLRPGDVKACTLF